MAGSKRQEQAAATQRQLLEAARTLFTERGFQATSVAGITEAANTAHGTFYLYFRNKEDVFIQIMASAMEELYRLTVARLVPITDRYDLAAARERIARYLTTAESHGRLLRALLEAILVNPTVEATWLDLRGRFQGAIAERLRAYQAMGELEGRNPDLMAGALVGMVEWLAFTRASFGVPGGPEDTEELIDTVTDLWGRGLGLAAAS